MARRRMAAIAVLPDAALPPHPIYPEISPAAGRNPALFQRWVMVSRSPARPIGLPPSWKRDGEKRDIKEGRVPPEWAKQPAKLGRKDRDAHWTVKYTKAKPNAEGMPRVDLVVPAFGYRSWTSSRSCHWSSPPPLAPMALSLATHDTFTPNAKRKLGWFR
jgi:hypothetical protein